VRETQAADLALVIHMLSCAGAIDEFLAGDLNRYRSSRLVRDAILRNLQILTESSRRLSSETKAGYPEVPWKQLAGFRNLLVHDYLGGIDDEAVVLVLERNLPDLHSTLLRMKEALGG
jgi:uncharacterized protein with HEPN domain